MSDAAILVDGLSKRYRIGEREKKFPTLRDSVAAMFRRGEKRTADTELWALKDVSFEVKQGEVTGVIGRNGAGKSTMLKILSRITDPTHGFAEIRGRVGSLLEVGTGFHPELTGRENIYLNGAILGMTQAEIRKKFDEIVAFAEVERFLDTPVKRYSSGMYVRLAFAVAAHLEPEILVIDEVLAVGDTAFQKKCLGKIKDVAGGGRTVLFVSHNMAALRTLCTRGVLLRGGKLANTGDVTTLIADYLSDATLGSGDAGFDRPVWARPWIKSVATRNAGLEQVSEFRVGEDILVDVMIECPDGQPLDHPVLTFIMRTDAHQPVTGISTRVSGYEAPRAIAKGTYRCTMMAPNLIHGQYSLELQLQDMLTYVDIVTVANMIRIVPTDTYGTGFFPDPAHGPLHLNSRWSYAEA